MTFPDREVIRKLEGQVNEELGERVLPHQVEHDWGVEVITSRFLTEAKRVERSWRERLLSWPWCPFQRFKEVSVPSEDVYIDIRRGIIYCHPSILEQVQEQLRKELNDE